MTPINVSWTDFKKFLAQISSPFKCLDMADQYLLYAFDHTFGMSCTVQKDSGSDQIDFEQNYLAKANGDIAATMRAVTTLYETNDKNLDMGKFKMPLVTGQNQIRLKIPGTFGADDGQRFIAGGYAQIDKFDADDYIMLDIYDDDRILAWAVAKSMNPSATQPVPDATMKQLEGLPSVGSVPNYPMVGSYNDTDMPMENQGWYFWPAPMGAGIAPQGELEFEPIAGYGTLPSEFYLVVTVMRPNPNVLPGFMRANLEWGSSAPLSTAFGG